MIMTAHYVFEIKPVPGKAFIPVQKWIEAQSLGEALDNLERRLKAHAERESEPDKGIIVTPKSINDYEFLYRI